VGATLEGSGLDRFIKYAGPLIGIVTAALSLFIAVTSVQTNRTLNDTRASVEELNLTSKTADLSARVVAEFGAQNAGEFASMLEQRLPPIEFLDAELQRQLTTGSLDWKEKRHLMTGSAETGLYLRQVVYVKLANLGKAAADDLRLVVRKKDFNESRGTQVTRYGSLDTQGPDWVDATLPLSALMERSPQTEGMRTVVLVPLAQVSGGEFYFGRVMVPVKLVWRDRLIDREQVVELNIARESALNSQLQSAILGRSVSAAR
jgi:hypothetical protein